MSKKKVIRIIYFKVHSSLQNLFNLEGFSKSTKHFYRLGKIFGGDKNYDEFIFPPEPLNYFCFYT